MILPGRAKKDGAEETHHRMGKTEDGGKEMRSPEKEETPKTEARSRAGELVVGTFNVRTLAFNRRNGIGHSEVILKVCQ